MGQGGAGTYASYSSVRITGIPISIHTLQSWMEKWQVLWCYIAGADAPELDQNLSEWLAKKGAANSEVDAESLADELYIDTVCIDPAFRGKGIGTKLFEYAEEVAKQNKHRKALFKRRNRKRTSHPTIQTTWL